MIRSFFLFLEESVTSLKATKRELPYLFFATSEVYKNGEKFERGKADKLTIIIYKVDASLGD